MPVESHWPRVRLSGEASLSPMIVFQIDEIGFLKKLGQSTELGQSTGTGLRSIFVNQPLARIILSGRELAMDPDVVSPWWNFLNLREVEPVTPKEAREIIVEPARGLFEFEEGVLQRIIGRAQGMPLVLNRLCADILRHKYEQNQGFLRQRRVTLADLDGALAQKRTEERRSLSSNPAPMEEDE